MSVGYRLYDVIYCSTAEFENVLCYAVAGCE